MQIKLSEFNIFPIADSARRADISDEIYFGEKYKRYISNSKLASICPSQGGSMEKYYGPAERIETSSLSLGTVIHTQTLQPGEFELAPKIDKPTAKLGLACDKYVKHIKKGLSKEEAARKACLEASYYVNQIEKYFPAVIEKGDIFYEKVKDYADNVFTLDNKAWDTAMICIENLKKDRLIQQKIHPLSDFLEELPSFNEDTLFLDFLVTYKDRYVKLSFKGKLDNWTIDTENKILTLNDLKTTGHCVAWFTNKEYGSFYKYHYARQLALYKIMLEELCKNEYGYTTKQWQFKTNILAVETVLENNTRCIPITNTALKEGKAELYDCIKRVAYYEMFGHKKEVKFV